MPQPITTLQYSERLTTDEFPGRPFQEFIDFLTKLQQKYITDDNELFINIESDSYITLEVWDVSLETSAEESARLLRETADRIAFVAQTEAAERNMLKFLQKKYSKGE
jgi:hypothetical protein